jgi:NAD(P)-dependent dehydrogenase (short-subunit alcohol dehydrogenase family)
MPPDQSSRSGLAGKVALVTGAARERGIGRGIVEALAAEGCLIAINDVVAAGDEAARLVRELESRGATARFYGTDVSDRRAVERMLGEIEDQLGPLHVACSNAGIASWSPFAQIDETSFDRLVAVNLTGAFNVGQAAARAMVARGTRGRIVFTSSVHVQMPFPEMALYGATKQALRALAETMAIELAAVGITVNHLGPGWVKSQLNDRSPSLQTAEDELATMRMIPAGRSGEPIEMGRAVAFLCSDEAAYITGEFLRVDGGFVVGKY